MMKRFIITIAVLTIGAFAGFAQKTEKAKFSIGVDAGVIVGSVSDVASMAIGASAKYNLPVCTKNFITLAAGYSYLPYTNDLKVDLTGYQASQSGGESYVPLKAGFKHFFNDVFYGEGQVGASISTQGGGVAFAYAPGVGLNFSAVDLGVRYEAWTKTNTISQVAMRLAYSF
jgi:hypothetical protein